MDSGIFCNGSGHVKNISVIGEVDTKNKVEKLMSLLNDANSMEINITFLDTSMLYADIVEKLDYLQKTAKCKIFVLKQYLFQYLYRLGLECKYVSKKSLEKKYSPWTPASNNGELNEAFNREDIVSFLKKVYAQYGYDYTGYQIGSLTRRIKTSMLREGIRNFEEFQAAVLGRMEVFEQLFLDFSINTTEFFRDPEVFLFLRNRVFPYLGSHAHIKIWCVGCSNGKEAYSLAIILEELGLLEKTHIYATDINHFIIEEAKNGLFSTGDIDKDILNYKKAGGTRSFVDYFDLKDTYMRVKKHMQKNILFFQHSLIGSGILNEFQLILCRNVLIYFNPQLQEEVLETFHKSLDISGFLVLGKSEGMLLNCGNAYFGKYLETEKIFRPK